MRSHYNVLKTAITGFAMACSLTLAAQTEKATNETSFELGSGLNFDLNNGDYQFKLGGMIEPSMAFSQLEDQDPDYLFNSRRTYLNFSGTAVKEKVSFFLQLDFSLSAPLLDAWIAYKPIKGLTITAGQMQNMANSFEMQIMEDKLQFPDRSLMSTMFSRSGREFGLFVEQVVGNDKFAIVPQASVTSGDGRNSFGADSRDADQGGLKYGGRLDIYPLGLFTKGNDDLVADLMHEEKPKLVIGAAGSYNDGASNAVGEGHGDFQLYNGDGETQLPDYRKLHADLLVKYKGFSLLGEYSIATATSLEGTFTDETVTETLISTQISEYLALGSAYNAQLGYVTRSGYALDLRYSEVMAEFDGNANSVLSNTTAWTAGFSKYFKGNALKLQAAVSSVGYADDRSLLMGEFLVQVVF